jgi:PST family polysaccharide transporter
MPPSSHLDRSLIRGIAWTSVIRWVTQLVSWVITLFVAHLLVPSDYGLVAMALIYFGFAQLMCDAGLTGAIVQTRDLKEPQLAAIGMVAGMVGIVLCALTLLTAPYVAAYFREGRVSGILMVLSLTFPVRALQILPRGLMARELQFRTLAFIDGIESMVVMTTTLVMALAGAGYWSLVGGPIIGTLVSTGCCFWWKPHRIAWPRDIESLRPALRIGGHLLVSNIAWYAYSNADFTVIGRVLGTAALGAYTLAWTIASVPVDRISSLVGRVTPAFFAAVQTDLPSLRRYLALLTEGLAFVTLPLCLGLFLTARDFVTAFLGERWSGVTIPLQLLALYAALRSVQLLAPQVLISTGRSGRNMMFSVLALMVLPPVFYFGTRWGTAGVAMGWVTVYPILVVLSFLRYALRAIEMRWSTYLAALIPAATASAGMTLAVWASRAAIPVEWGVRPRFAIEVAAGVIGYCGVAWLVHHRRIAALVTLLRTRGSAREREPAERFQREGHGIGPAKDILAVPPALP